MQIPENEDLELELLREDEDRSELDRSDVPDAVKAEIGEGLERRRESQLDEETGEADE